MTDLREQVARAIFDLEWDLSCAEKDFAGQREIHWRVARPRRLLLADAALAAMPQHEIAVYGLDGSRTVEMRPVPLTAKGQRCCSICETPLDILGRPWTRSCGGDCLACMADVGDPEALAAMPGRGGVGSVLAIPSRLITNVATLSRSGRTVTIDCDSPDDAEEVLSVLEAWPVSAVMPGGGVPAFARAVLHGDEDHREWLMEAAEAWCAGAALPPPRGKGTSSFSPAAPTPPAAAEEMKA